MLLRISFAVVFILTTWNRASSQIRTRLIDPPVMETPEPAVAILDSLGISFYFPEFQYIGQEPSISSFIWPADWAQVVYVSSECGKTYDAKDNLVADCECNADSVLHGKSVHWDSYGRISSVYYYRDGKMYTEKIYSEGKLTKFSNYTYKNGDRIKHGKQIKYTPYYGHPKQSKTIKNYRWGKKEGAERRYAKGKLYLESIFKNDVRTKERQWDKEGRITAESQFDEKGEPHGTIYHFEYAPKKEFIQIYNHGESVSSQTFIEGILIQEIINSDDGVYQESDFYGTGQKQSLYRKSKDGIVHMQKWKIDGTQIQDYHYNSESGSAIGTGYTSFDNSIIYFSEIKSTDRVNYLECYKVIDGDTVEFYYAENDHYFHRSALHRNHYMQLNGRAVKTGKWTTYSDNKIISIIHYRNGEVHGAITYYDTTKTDPQPYLTGFIHDGKRNGAWTYRSDTLVIQQFYELGNRSREYKLFRIHSDTLRDYTSDIYGIPVDFIQESGPITPVLKCSYEKDQLTYKCYLYYTDGKLFWIGDFLNNKRNGSWIQYNEKGEKIVQGQYDLGTPERKWRTLGTKRNGKLEWRKVPYVPLEPEIESLIIEIPPLEQIIL